MLQIIPFRAWLLLFALLSVVSSAVASPSHGDKIEVDGLYYRFDSWAGTATLADYVSEPLGDLVIPATVTYEGVDYSVTCIGQSAFANCSGLTSAVIPNGVTKIEGFAFYKCSGLTSVTIPNSVADIGSYVFADCSHLESVEIPNSVVTLGGSVFDGCKALRSIVIPGSVESIGNYLFADCPNLVSVVVDPNNKVFDSRDGCNAIIHTATNELVTGCGKSTIPNSVVSIMYQAFWQCAGLTSISIPSSVKSIGESAFTGCSDLSSIVVEPGNSVYDSREGCNAIIHTAADELVVGCRNSTVPSSVVSIGPMAFSGCSGLVSLDVPNSVKSIGVSAFNGCVNLASIDLPNSLTSIAYAAFAFCSSLASVTIPCSVTDIDDNGVFGGCPSLTSIRVDAGNLVYDSREDCNAIVHTATDCLVVGCMNTVIPSSVSSIGNMAFAGCTALTSVTLPQSVKDIGRYAFTECKGLADIYIHAEVPPIVSGGALSGCDNLSTIYVPVGAKSVYEKTRPWKSYDIVEKEFLTNAGSVLATDSAEASGAPMVYDLLGHRVGASAAFGIQPKGIYIVDGKKVLK